MSNRWLRFGTSAAALFGLTSVGAAATYIPTNLGAGADAEVREEFSTDGRPNTDPVWGPILTPRGRNRGGVIGETAAIASGMELATRILDQTTNPAGDRTSAMYLKFDITGITQAQLDNNETHLRLTVRNADQFRWSRIWEMNPYYGSLPADNTNPEFVNFRAHIGNWTRVKWNLYGLTPEPMDAADPRRFGDADPTLPVPNYDWIEHPTATGDPCPETSNCGGSVDSPQSLDETTWDAVRSPLIGPVGPITWYNAPGITPDSRTTPVQDAGKYNFNSDLELLGQVTPLNPPGNKPTNPDGGADLPVGGNAINFKDPDGSLHDLIQRAKDEGRSTITLVVAHALNGFRNTSPEMLQTTPGNFLNFNYLVNPKEQDDRPAEAGLQLRDDPNWDPDGAGPLVATGSPFSCDGLPPNPNSANCPGMSVGNNDNGRFSPTLVLIVPEPGSMALVGLGMLAATMIGRRRK